MYIHGAGPHLRSRGPPQLLLLPEVCTWLLQVRPERLLHHCAPGQIIDCLIPKRCLLALRAEFTVNDGGARDMAIVEIPAVIAAAAACTTGVGADVCMEAS
mmetsp:Transcript_59520/g.114887  ORF Transcript_59520/g.114887 Transcript_59520/m.114887 type:complete len:101 (+) Transcript_59520:268-570(+)